MEQKVLIMKGEELELHRQDWIKLNNNLVINWFQLALAYRICSFML